MRAWTCLDEERPESSGPEDDHPPDYHLPHTEHLGRVPHLARQALCYPPAGQSERLDIVQHQPEVGVEGGDNGGRDEPDGTGEIVEPLGLKGNGHGCESGLDKIAIRIKWIVCPSSRQTCSIFLLLGCDAGTHLKVMIPPSREAISVGTLFKELKMAMMGIYVWSSIMLKSKRIARIGRAED
jgi:hypothetical protein